MALVDAVLAANEKAVIVKLSTYGPMMESEALKGTFYHQHAHVEAHLDASKCCDWVSVRP